MIVDPFRSDKDEPFYCLQTRARPDFAAFPVSGNRVLQLLCRNHPGPGTARETSAPFAAFSLHGRVHLDAGRVYVPPFYLSCPFPNIGELTLQEVLHGPGKQVPGPAALGASRTTLRWRAH